MRAVDTNVLAQLILADDAVQLERARALLLEPVWVTPTVWLELGWLLGTKLRLDRAAMADALVTLLAIETVHTDHRSGLHWAIDRLRSGADWADAMHILMAGGIADSFATFDRGIALAIVDSPIPIETLA